MNSSRNLLSNRVNNKGFLLLEVIVSIVIITAGLLFVTRSYLASKNSIQRSTEVFKTSLLLEARIWEFEEKGEIGQDIKTGDFVEDKDYSWSINAEPIEDTDLTLVRLEVFQKKDPQNTKYSILTYLKTKTE